MLTEYLVAREGHFQVLKIQFIQLIIFKVLVTAGLLAIGGILVLNQQMNIGQFVAAEIIILLIIGSVEKIILGLESFYDILTSLEKMGEVVDKKLEEQEGDEPFNLGEPLTIQFDGVNYKGFNEERIIKNVSFKINPGDRILLKGANGAGKSTLLKLLAGLIRPSVGEIYVNDLSLKSVKLNHYRGMLGHSITEETPFEGTILENITLGDQDIPIQDIQWALEKTGLLGFVRQQPKGLNTMIYPEGIQMPFSVSKKLILARSIVRRPSVLILNDPLNQLDPEEEERILNFLFSEENKWAILVAGKGEKLEKLCKRQLFMKNGKLTNKI